MTNTRGSRWDKQYYEIEVSSFCFYQPIGAEF